MKQFKGKAIVMPKGKAAEYAKFSCNFYVGCSNGCEYCYLKKVPLKKTMGGDVPTLKKCFKNEAHALEVFEKELLQNLPELQKYGLFFTFTSDPMLPETIKLTTKAVMMCVGHKVPVKILTKRADWFIPVTDDYHNENLYKVIWGEIMHDTLLFGSEFYYEFGAEDIWYELRNYVAIGFTLTGEDKLEPTQAPTPSA